MINAFGAEAGLATKHEAIIGAAMLAAVGKRTKSIASRPVSTYENLVLSAVTGYRMTSNEVAEIAGCSVGCVIKYLRIAMDKGLVHGEKIVTRLERKGGKYRAEMWIWGKVD